MISRKGIFVFESKNYSGWIFGSDNQKYWYQTLPSGQRKSHKEKFYNPIFQNNNHIKYLKFLIGNQVPFYSIITFSERCTLKNINLQSSNAIVINRYQVYNIVSSIYNNISEDLLSDIQVKEIYNTLYPLTQIDENIKQKHIDDIYNSLNYNSNNANLFINKNKYCARSDEIGNINESLCFEKKQNNKLNKNESKEPKKETLICPVCGDKLILRKARYGLHVGKSFYGCSNYPKCKYIRRYK